MLSFDEPLIQRTFSIKRMCSSLCGSAFAKRGVVRCGKNITEPLLKREMKKLLLTLLFLPPLLCFGQTVITLDSAISSALKNHPLLQLSQQEIEHQKALKLGSFNLENPSVWYEAPYGPEFKISLQQNFQNPVLYQQQSKLGKHNILLAEKSKEVNRMQVIRDVRNAYLQLQYAEIKVVQLMYQDSIFKILYDVAEQRYDAGDAGLLEKVIEEAKSKQIENLLKQGRRDVENAQKQLQIVAILQFPDSIGVAPIIHSEGVMKKMKADVSILTKPDTGSIAHSPLLNYYAQNISVNKQNLKLQKWKLSPGLSVGYFDQSGYKDAADNGVPLKYLFRYGITLPVWFWIYTAQIKAAKYQYEMSQSQYGAAQITFNVELTQAINDYKKFSESLNYYEQTGLKLAETIITAAKNSKEYGEIGYIVYIQSLIQAFEIEMSYYESLRDYNQSIIQINYLNGQ